MSTNPPHRDRQFFIARGVFGLAGAILISLVAWIALRAGGSSASAADTPLLVQPSTGLRAAESTVVPSATGTAPVSSGPAVAATSPSASPSPSRTSASPKPSKTSASPKPSVTRTTTPPVSRDLSLSCGINAWNGGFVANATVTNNGSQAHSFRVTFTFSGSVRVLNNPWNSRATSTSGQTITLVGSSALAPHSNVMVGFSGSADDPRRLRVGCSVAVTG
ncbi:DNA-directed RNA polymerase II subunit RPB1 [Actinoplanes sp. SE50]|uniref:cellulose binding domain-containing protein n=1 Tax=unclassified Actinoplanes TaxID=2626549 RepID=UPI00023EC730|nr:MULTISPECIES: cellulose binding domain-containing protein [unclassified Actinoplanes]AEV81980.1 DNA-directed RNA polymerase II subunit RPB1 [Actinoplanes sp. SE50/110]ATO80380.1 DNA-directed RNA polymerase II subunit RPB1 [Actinoplanes sp. SE50]SLL97786.1 DNA-directed RNA polymerase II subunit RPB1 [Actinoplanes sp. SE50/110]